MIALANKSSLSSDERAELKRKIKQNKMLKKLDIFTIDDFKKYY